MAAIRKDAKPKMGRPSNFNRETFAEICRQLGGGESLTQICLKPGMPSRPTVQRWMDEHADIRADYVRARELQAAAYVDKMLHIADTTSDPALARVKVDTLKWVSGRLHPKLWGDKVTQEISGPEGGPVQVVTTDWNALRAAMKKVP